MRDRFPDLSGLELCITATLLAWSDCNQIRPLALQDSTDYTERLLAGFRGIKTSVRTGFYATVRPTGE